MPKSILTQSELKNRLIYDQNTGNFIRRISVNRWPKGTMAGNINNEGYCQIKIDDVIYKAHRLAFLYMTGDIPDQVDHINHIRDDNRWCNLRAANNKINQQNAMLRKSNTSGFCGVYWYKRYQKWVVRISGKTLGYFHSKEDAINAREKANSEYGFHRNHGKLNVT